MEHHLYRSLCLAALLCIASAASTSATDVSGTQSTTWRLDASPYYLVGDVLVPSRSRLIIEPGVTVIARGHYRIRVAGGRLDAIGTPEAPITFTALNEVSGWRGIRLENADDASVISYCIVEFARGSGTVLEAQGGGLLIRECSPTVRNSIFRFNSTHAQSYNGGGGAIYAFISSALIEHNVIIDNSADSGGGIVAADYGTTTIRYNYIANNVTLRAGGGIHIGSRSTAIVQGNILLNNQSGGLGGGGISSWTGYPLYLTFPTIRNNLIAYNTTTTEGGGIYARYDRAIISNNIIAYNEADLTGGGIYALNFPDAVPIVTNTILWGNSALSAGDQVYTDPITSSGISIAYSTIQAGWPGVGNDSLAPLFLDPDGPDDVPGTQDDDFRVAWDSPCIDAGDPSFVAADGETDLDHHARVLCDRVDRGAYESAIGDMDCDGVVDLMDFADWDFCQTGPANGPHAEGCTPFDFNADGDIDQSDFAALQRVMSE